VHDGVEAPSQDQGLADVVLDQIQGKPGQVLAATRAEVIHRDDLVPSVQEGAAQV